MNNGFKNLPGRAHAYRMKEAMAYERLAELCDIDRTVLSRGINAFLGRGPAYEWSDLTAAKIKRYLDSVGAPDV